MAPEPAAVTGSYAPGEGAAIATAGVWVLVGAPPSDPVVAEVWVHLHEDGVDGVDAVVEALSTAERAFATVTAVGGAPTLVLGGGAWAEVEVTGSSELFRCPASLHRADHRFRRRPSSIHLYRQPSGETAIESATALLPLAIGIASAGHLLLTFDTVGERPEPTVGAGAAASAAGASSSMPPRPPAAKSISDTRVGEDQVTRSPKPEGRLERVIPEPSRDSSRELDANVESGESIEELGYGFLFGNTVNRSVADAAVHSDDDEQATPAPPPAIQSQLSGADTLLEVPMEAEIVAAETPPSAVPSKAPGMIESVPSWSSGASTSVPAASASSREASPSAVGANSEELGLTMSRSAADALVRQIAVRDEAVPQPTVHAVHCGSGHPNPPHADLCRVCGQAVAVQAPVTVPRPVLGYLRFSTGDVIPLDRNVLIGRQPTPDRLVDGTRPHVVKVPSPEKEISRNHLEVRLDDWHVLVTDLNSTNGTILTRIGRAPERIRPGQAMMIEPGTRVSLADDVSFAFEAK